MIVLSLVNKLLPSRQRPEAPASEPRAGTFSQALMAGKVLPVSRRLQCPERAVQPQPQVSPRYPAPFTDPAPGLIAKFDTDTFIVALSSLDSLLQQERRWFGQCSDQVQVRQVCQKWHQLTRPMGVSR